MVHSGQVNQLADEVDHFAPQKDSNIYKTTLNNIKSLFKQTENTFIHGMIIILLEGHLLISRVEH